MSEPGPVASMQSLTEHQCRQYLQAGTVGRIAFQVGTEVEIFPVNYAADGTIVLFRTASGTMLERCLEGRVAFEVDGWDEAKEVAWSVVLKGVAAEVTRGADPFAAALRRHRVAPLAPGDRERWIAVYPASVTGRRFHSAAGGASDGSPADGAVRP